MKTGGKKQGIDTTEILLFVSWTRKTSAAESDHLDPDHLDPDHLDQDHLDPDHLDQDQAPTHKYK